jgi:hypothetical protein
MGLRPTQYWGACVRCLVKIAQPPRFFKNSQKAIAGSPAIVSRHDGQDPSNCLLG